MFDFMSKDVGSATDNTGINWSELLKTLAANGEGKSGFGGMQAAPLGQQQGQSNIYSVPSSIPKKEKKGDSSGAAINVLLKMFGL